MRSIAILVWLILVGGCSPQADHPFGRGTQAKSPLPLLDMTGGPSSLVLPDDRVVVLNFWSVFCAPCREEMPSLQRLQRMVDADRVKVIGISVDRDRFLIEEFIRQYGVTFSTHIDPDKKVSATHYGVKWIPETVIIGPGGRIEWRHTGIMAWDQPSVVSLLDELLPQGSLPAQRYSSLLF